MYSFLYVEEILPSKYLKNENPHYIYILRISLLGKEIKILLPIYWHKMLYIPYILQNLHVPFTLISFHF